MTWTIHLPEVDRIEWSPGHPVPDRERMRKVDRRFGATRDDGMPEFFPVRVHFQDGRVCPAMWSFSLLTRNCGQNVGTHAYPTPKLGVVNNA
jgi:hypothetical protein